MADKQLGVPLREGGQPSILPGVGPVDPLAIRAKLMLETTSFMMAEWDWPYREATIDLKSSGDELGSFRLFGANHPDSIRQVFERKVDISIMNPSVILSMAYRGLGFFSEPMQVALIAVMPHYDQLGFAVTKASGLTSIDDIREKRFPLRVSVRGSLDATTSLMAEMVLRVHGFDFQDIISWGGKVSYDQPMPHQALPGHASRMERVVAGELDAIFEEGVVVWAPAIPDAGMRLLEIDDAHLAELEILGFKPGKIEKARFDWLERDVATVDYSGWPIYTRIDAPDLLIRKFCEGMEARKGSIPWNWGPVRQKDMPLERMVVDAPDTPIDIPFHPAAEEFWMKMGYLK